MNASRYPEEPADGAFVVVYVKTEGNRVVVDVLARVDAAADRDEPRRRWFSNVPTFKGLVWSELLEDPNIREIFLLGEKIR